MRRPFRLHSLKYCRQILVSVHRWYHQHWQTLGSEELSQLEEDLSSLDQAILGKRREEADSLARRLETYKTKRMPTTWTHWIKEVVIALILALVIATVVRQVWFELYQIPTGSMRPTFREGDHLIVSKTSYGINVPLRAAHLYFDPEQVERTSPVVFTGHNLALSDNDDRYFWVFPFKKRYIKRMIAKPGDTLYFYGGQIYGIDLDGNPIPELISAKAMHGIEHIPFHSFEGDVEVGGSVYQPHFDLKQYQIPLARLEADAQRQLRGSVLAPQGYGTAFGIENYGMVRLLTAEEAKKYSSVDLPDDPNALLYAEIRHHPTIDQAELYVDNRSGYRVQAGTSTTLLPLHRSHLDALMAQMYTNRFWVQDDYVLPYYAGRQKASDYPHAQHLLLRLPGVPNGLYEFYHGVPVAIGVKGWESQLSAKHPLTTFSVERVQTLFNYGVEWFQRVGPSSAPLQTFPARYVYYRDGDLYMLGGKVISSEDPVLQEFIAREQQKASTTYSPFIDSGPPVDSDGVWNSERILKYGLRVPDRHYLCLGDNHAFSADGRTFGFVPEDNLRGTPQFLLWPPGERWGLSARSGGSPWNLPTLFILIPVSIATIAWVMYRRRQLQQPVFQKQSLSS